MDRNLNKNRSLLICLILILVTFAVYYQVHSFKFITLDDAKYIYKNPHIQTGITIESIKWAFTASYASNWHPLTWLSLMVDWQLFGSNPAGFHFTNLIFHIANALLLFLVLKQMTSAIWQSAFVAALFALHPLHVESVAWVAERKDVLSAFFWLLTMWVYVRYVKHPNVWRYLFALLMFSLGLMSKPMLVTLPFVLLLLDYWPLERFGKRTFFYLIREKIPFIVLSAASSIITFLVQRSGGAVVTTAAIPMQLRGSNAYVKYFVSNAFVSYIKYLEKMFWPSRLAVYYPHPLNGLTTGQVAGAVLILLVISVLVIRLAAGRRYLFTGWFWYLGTLVPVIGFVQVGAQAMADRYSYIPLTGLFIIIAWSLPELLGKWSYRKMVLWTSSLIVLFILTALTYLQLQYWRDSITLYQHALAVTKNNYTINFSITQPLLDQGRNEEAVLHCSEALRIIPDDLSAQIGLTGALLAAGRLDQVEIECQKFLQKEPNDPDLLNNLGIAFGRQGKFDQAVKYLTKALQIKPDFADAHTNIGYVLTIQSNLDEAAVHLYKALQLDPDSALAHYYFGNILVQSGKINEAVTHFEKALKLKPDWVELMNSLAWILAVQPEMTSHNPDKAVKLAQRACELTNYQEPELLDTLSVAYAAAGDFNKAVEIAQKALELCQSGEKKILKKEIEKRLVLYKENKPYIEAAK